MSNINLHYKVEGKGETIVFLHGLSDNLNYWEILATNLKKDYQVIRFDLPGHGQSQMGEDEMDVDLIVDSLLVILDELNADNINLVGFSLGSAIALDFILKYPKKANSLVLMSGFSKVDEHMKSVFSDFKNDLNMGFKEFYDNILPKVLCPDVIRDNRVELDLLKQRASQTANTQAYIKIIDAFWDFDLEDKLSEVSVPTLILAGKYDKITPVSIQMDICEKIDGSELIIFDDVKHNLLVGKNNMKILDILKNFLKNKK